MSTRKTTEVTDEPGSTTHWSVPDTWDARSGIAFVVLEIFVGALQAFVFTILTAIYIQMALADEH